mgnify:CR=1 FL=1
MKKIVTVLISLIFTLNAQSIYANFHIEAKKSANLAFDASGVVKEVFADVSSVVRKGDRLAELYNDDIKASLDIAKASLESAKVALKFAKKDYDRHVIIKHLVDEALFDKYAQSYESAKTAIIQAEANVAYQKALYNKTTLYAPFDGIIFEKKVQEGDVVSGMMLRTIFKIQSLKERKLLLSFDQKYWKKVKVNQKFKYRVDGDSKEYEGTISKIYPHVNDEKRKLNAEVKADGLIVGLFGEGYIHVEEKE